MEFLKSKLEKRRATSEPRLIPELSSNIGLQRPDVESYLPTRRRIAVPSSISPLTNSSFGSEESEPHPDPEFGDQLLMMTRIANPPRIMNSSFEDEPCPNQELGNQLLVLEHAAGDADDDTSVNDNARKAESESLYSAATGEGLWLMVTIATGAERICDIRSIEPYSRVLLNGGCYSHCGSPIIVLSACHLPDNAHPDYNYIMDNLFLYVIWSLDRLAGDSYVLVYLHGGARSSCLPTWSMMYQWYKCIGRRIRKRIKHFYLVHPSIWLRSILTLSKPFISWKFSSKLTCMRNLAGLMEAIPVNPDAIPELVKRYDEQLNP